MLGRTPKLCIQVTQALGAYGAGRGVDVVAMVGGAPIREQASHLQAGAGGGGPGAGACWT